MKIVDLNEGKLDLPPVSDESDNEKPPIAQDFTDNPFSEVEPVKLPSTEEKEAVWDKMRSKFKVVHEYVKSGNELDGGKLKLSEDGSELAANVVSAVLGLVFSLMGEEYTILAASKEQAYRIIHPAARIVVRHSKIAGEISPDYIDASECLRAVAEYTRTVMTGIRQIREMKAQGFIYAGQPGWYEQPGGNGVSGNYPPAQPGFSEQEWAERRATESAYTGQNGASGAALGQSDFGGPPSNGYEPRGNLGTVGTQSPGDLTPEQQRAYEKLRQLTERDIRHRQRRAGVL